MKKCEYCGKEISYFDMYCTDEGQEKGDLADDSRTYEVQRDMAVAVNLPRYFGVWKFN